MRPDDLLICRASDRDLPGVLDLLELNYTANLTEEQRKDGFLTVRFDAAQLKAMAADGIMIVALRGTRVVGFLSAQSCRFNLAIPIARTMLESLSKSIEEDRTLVCGPVCIDAACRGQGLFERMYARLIAETAGAYTTGVTFVSDRNPRSIAAHQDKLGMQAAGRFEHDGLRFHIFRLEFRSLWTLSPAPPGSPPRPGWPR